MSLLRLLGFGLAGAAIGALLGYFVAPTLIPYLPGAITTKNIEAYRSDLASMGALVGGILGFIGGIRIGASPMFRQRQV